MSGRLGSRRRGPGAGALVGLVVLLIVAAACGGGDDDDPTTTTSRRVRTTATTEGARQRANVDGELRLGTLLPMTGRLSALGPPTVQGARMAVRDVNAAGGVLGKPIVLAEADDATDDRKAAQAVERLLGTEKVDAIVGPAGPRTALAVVDRITAAGVVQCSPAVVVARLTTYPDDGFFFRTAPPDSLQAKALADLVVADTRQRVAVVAVNEEYGRSLSRLVKRELAARRVAVVADVAFDPSDASLADDAAKVSQPQPDAVVVIAAPTNGGPMLQAMVQAGVGPRNVGVYVTDGLQTTSLWERVDASNRTVVQGIKGTAPATAPQGDPPAGPAFTRAFAAFAPGVRPIFSAHAYDCVVVVALATEATGRDDPRRFVDRMVDVTTGGTKCRSFAECAALLHQGADVDYDGVSGPLDLTTAGEPSVGAYEVFEFQADGSYRVLRQVQVVDQDNPARATTSSTGPTSPVRNGPNSP